MDCISPQLFANHSTYQNGLHPSSKVLGLEGAFQCIAESPKEGLSELQHSRLLSLFAFVEALPLRGMMANMWRVSNHGLHT